MNIFERRCSGHCCKAFILPWLSPDEIKNEKKFYHRDAEGLKILNMIIYLGNDPINFPQAARKVIPIGNFKPTPNAHYYTCKHHCNITGNCLIYNDRPKMCRTFPDQETNWKGACGFRGCTKRYSLKELILFNFKRIIHSIEVNIDYKVKWYIRDNFEWCFQECKSPNPCKEIRGSSYFEDLIKDEDICCEREG